MSSIEVQHPPAAARVFRAGAVVGFADVAPSGRARLDAIARWLQDVAFADLVDAAIGDEGVWVIRRMRIQVQRFPRLHDPVELATFCSGAGALWAERRTTIAGPGGARIEAVALWVYLDADGSRPRALPPAFQAVYGPSIAGRRVRARLRHPAEPAAGAEARPWRFRAADLDVADHVNNAVYWQLLEEDLIAAEAVESIEAVDAEIEHVAEAGAGEASVLVAEPMRWLVDADGALLATLTTAPEA